MPCRCFEMVTTTNAAIMDWMSSLAVGKLAGCVVLDAADPVEAIRLRAIVCWSSHVAVSSPAAIRHAHPAHRPSGEVSLRFAGPT